MSIGVLRQAAPLSLMTCALVSALNGGTGRFFLVVMFSVVLDYLKHRENYPEFGLNLEMDRWKPR